MNKEQEFGMTAHHGIHNNPGAKKVRPTNGKLVLVGQNKETVLEYDKPFPLLQHLKKQYIVTGQYLSSELKIKHL